MKNVPATPNTVSRPNISLTPRGELARKFAIGTITVLGALGAYNVASSFVSAVGPNYTDAELAKMAKPFTPQIGDTAEGIVGKIEPGVLADAETRAEVLDYMADQNPDGFVQAGVPVEVPRIPGEQATHTQH